MDDRSNPILADELRPGLDLYRLASTMIRSRDGTILFWARGMEHLYGYSAEEALGRCSHELLRTEFPRPLAEIEDELTRRGEWTGELVHYRRDGEARTIATHWSLRDSAVTVVNSDITTLKHAEQDLSAREAHLKSILET